MTALKADGVVVHKLNLSAGSKDPMGGMGIKFSDLDKNSKALLESYLQKSTDSSDKKKKS